jgi:hypothetical protein
MPSFARRATSILARRRFAVSVALVIPVFPVAASWCRFVARFGGGGVGDVSGDSYESANPIPAYCITDHPGTALVRLHSLTSFHTKPIPLHMAKQEKRQASALTLGASSRSAPVRQTLGLTPIDTGSPAGSLPVRLPGPLTAPLPASGISPQHPLGRPIDIAGVASLIGCSTWTVRQRLIPRGLPCFRSGASGKLIFYENQVIRWIERQQHRGGKRM